MNITSLAIPDVKVIAPQKFGDHRGFFSETYNVNSLKEFGIDVDFVQDNHSMSRDIGVLRGLHFQKPPFAQDKLVRVVKGKIWDVVVDLRLHSETYKKWVTVEISAENWAQVFIPKGFAHGFIALEKNTEVIYKVTDFYSPENEVTIKWDDETLNIEWPIEVDKITVSAKDEDGLSFSGYEAELKTITW